MKSVLVINSIRYPEHEVMGKQYQRVMNQSGTCVIIDMGLAEGTLYDKFLCLHREKPDWIMTFDLAGFEFRDAMGRASLNTMPCRMAHLMNELPSLQLCAPEDDVNFSVYFYLPQNRQAEDMRRRYPNIEHILTLPELDDPAQAENNLRKIWEDTEMTLDFTECRLSGTM